MPALFYHVTQSRVDAVATALLTRAIGQGWRVLLRTSTAETARFYDDCLWKDHDFLPHGLAGGEHDALQPVLIAPTGDIAGFRAAMTVAGAEITPDEVSAVDRVWILFDGQDPMAVDRARAQWRALTGAGISAQYWSEESGRWEKKAET